MSREREEMDELVACVGVRLAQLTFVSVAALVVALGSAGLGIGHRAELRQRLQEAEAEVQEVRHLRAVIREALAAVPTPEECLPQPEPPADPRMALPGVIRYFMDSSPGLLSVPLGSRVSCPDREMLTFNGPGKGQKGFDQAVSFSWQDMVALEKFAAWARAPALRRPGNVGWITE